MNRTKSGNFAVGDPMSLARIKSEISYALDNNIKSLWQTDEGQYILRVFKSKSGMSEDERNFVDYLYEFSQGILTGIELPGIITPNL